MKAFLLSVPFRLASALAIACSAVGFPAFVAAAPAFVGSGGAVIAPDPLHFPNIRDLGLAPQTLPVRIALTLHYRHESELDALIELQSNPRSQYYHRYLSNRQFADYFAPLPATEAHVVDALNRAGFTVTQRYTNRTIVDAVAPAAVAARYFSTEIHAFVQPGHGTRYAAVRPASVPPELGPSVSSVSGLSNLIHLHTDIRFATPAQRALARERALTSPAGLSAGLVGTRVAGWHAPAQLQAAPASIGNAVADPGFESGRLGAWQEFTTVPDAILQNRVSHTGRYAAFIGSPTPTSGEINGATGLAQAVTIPANGVLSFWVLQGSNESNAKTSWQEADLVDYSGRRLVNFFATVNNGPKWRQLTYRVGARAGQRVYLYFGVHGNGDKHHRTYQYIDDVSLAGSAYPVNGAPIGGPIFGPDFGYGPVVFANDYNLPVQHHYDGSGRTTGIAISGDYSDADLFGYLSEFGITRGGTTTRVAVDGGSKYDPNTDDTAEATLDVETIVGLAPSTHLFMYLFPDLGDVSILDGYNRAVSDNSVDVINSSFGGCEVGDRGFDLGVYRIVAQAAAKGITFSASSGDQGSTACADSNGIPATGVNVPASSPDVVAVGGTILNINFEDGSYLSEDGWFDSTGGVSVVYAKPAYQVHFPGVTGSGRNVPDIAFDGDPATGASYYLAGSWQGPIGGTSLSSPIFCALLTEVDQTFNSRFGYVNPAIYNLLTHDGGYTKFFRDITDGSNGDYNAKHGYDLVTGIGSMRNLP